MFSAGPRPLEQLDWEGLVVNSRKQHAGTVVIYIQHQGPFTGKAFIDDNVAVNLCGLDLRVINVGPYLVNRAGLGASSP